MPHRVRSVKSESGRAPRSSRRSPGKIESGGPFEPLNFSLSACCGRCPGILLAEASNSAFFHSAASARAASRSARAARGLSGLPPPSGCASPCPFLGYASAVPDSPAPYYSRFTRNSNPNTSLRMRSCPRRLSSFQPASTMRSPSQTVAGPPGHGVALGGVAEVIPHTHLAILRALLLLVPQMRFPRQHLRPESRGPARPPPTSGTSPGCDPTPSTAITSGAGCFP